jgi:branched-chain amino acid transport system permease protein
MTWQRSGELLVMVILGGAGSLWGAILGALALLMMEEFLSRFTEQGNLILGPALVLVALMGRGGLAGGIDRLFPSPAVGVP